MANGSEQGMLALGAGLGGLVLFVRAASGAIVSDARALGQRVTYVLVLVAGIYFLRMFVGGNLTADERRRVGTRSGRPPLKRAPDVPLPAAERTARIVTLERHFARRALK